MSGLLDDNIERWIARQKSALAIEIIQGKTVMTEASRSYDLAPSEISCDSSSRTSRQLRVEKRAEPG